MDSIKLDVSICTELLIKCVELAQRKGAFPIKDASALYKVITYLKTDIQPKEKDKDFPELDKKSSIETLIKGVVIGNSKGAYSLEEAALLDRIITFLQAPNVPEQVSEEQQNPVSV